MPSKNSSAICTASSKYVTQIPTNFQNTQILILSDQIQFKTNPYIFPSSLSLAHKFITPNCITPSHKFISNSSHKLPQLHLKFISNSHHTILFVTNSSQIYLNNFHFIQNHILFHHTNSLLTNRSHIRNHINLKSNKFETTHISSSHKSSHPKFSKIHHISSSHNNSHTIPSHKFASTLSQFHHTTILTTSNSHSNSHSNLSQNFTSLIFYHQCITHSHHKLSPQNHHANCHITNSCYKFVYQIHHKFSIHLTNSSSIHSITNSSQIYHTHVFHTFKQIDHTNFHIPNFLSHKLSYHKFIRQIVFSKIMTDSSQKF